MFDYDVVVRIPIRARDMGEAYCDAANVEESVQHSTNSGASLEKVECTGSSEET